MKASQCKGQRAASPHHGWFWLHTYQRQVLTVTENTAGAKHLCPKVHTPLNTDRLTLFQMWKEKNLWIPVIMEETRELLENNIQLNCFLKCFRITSLSKEQIYRAVNGKHLRKNKEKTWLVVTSMMTMAHSASGWRPSTLEIKVFAFIF